MKKIIIAFLLLTACQLGPGTSIPVPPDIYIGTSALEASFNPSSNNNIYMCRQSKVLVDVRNTGAFDIENGIYSFIFEEQVLKSLDEKQVRFSLEGKSVFNPPGGRDQLQFRLENIGLPEQLETYNSPLIFQSCYKYKTFASAPICIDPDVQNLNQRKACLPQPVTLGGSQGAPVAITQVDSIMIPEDDKVRPVFAVYVQHVGTGRIVTEEGADVACTAAEDVGQKLLSLADVTVKLQGRELACSPDPVAIEIGQEAMFVCEDDKLYGLAEGTFSTVLEVELSYGYFNTLVLPITITRLPGQGACN